MSQSKLRKIGISVGLGTAAVIATIAALNLTTQMGQAQTTIFQAGNATTSSNDNTTTAAALEFTQDNLQQRRKAATAAVLALPQVKSIIDTAFIYAVDFHWLENKDVVTISTWG